MTEGEYKARFIKQLERNHKSFFIATAHASWEVYNDDSEGLKDEMPEDMANEEMSCWG